MKAIISHDAGGAEVLSSYVKRNPGAYKFYLEGPARKIFQNKLGVESCISLNEAISDVELVICGTSWQSNLEIEGIRKAKASNTKVIAFLDHWANYRERFIRENKAYYPDELWVGDQNAFDIANRELPNIQIELLENPYFLCLKAEIKKLKSSLYQDVNVLYICEPIKEHAFLSYGDERYWGYTEDEAMEFFFKNLKTFEPFEKVLIRPHPSEKVDKYDWLIEKYPNISVVIGGAKPLLEEIMNSHTIVGCESMAMVIGLFADKIVVSTIPPSGKRSSLPHKEIRYLSDLCSENAK